MSTNRGSTSRFMPGTRLVEGIETENTLKTTDATDDEEVVSSTISCDVLTCSQIEVDDSILCNGILNAALSQIGELALGDITFTGNEISVDPEKQTTLIIGMDTVNSGAGIIDIRGNLVLSNPTAEGKSDVSSTATIKYDSIEITANNTYVKGNFVVEGDEMRAETLDTIVKDNILTIGNDPSSTYTADSNFTRGLLIKLEAADNQIINKSVGLLYSTSTNNTLFSKRFSLGHSSYDGFKSGGDLNPDGKTGEVTVNDYVGLNLKDINLFTDSGSLTKSLNYSNNSIFQDLTFQTGNGTTNYGTIKFEASKIKMSDSSSSSNELEIYADNNNNSFKNLIFKTYDSNNDIGFIKFNKTSISLDTSSSFLNPVDIISNNNTLTFFTKTNNNGDSGYLRLAGNQIIFDTEDTFINPVKFYLSTVENQEGFLMIDTYLNNTDATTLGTYEFRGVDYYINDTLNFKKPYVNGDTFESGVEITTNYNTSKKSLIFTTYGDYQEDQTNNKYQKIVFRGNMIQFSDNDGNFPTAEDTDNSQKRVVIRHGDTAGQIVLGHNVKILGTLENSGDLSVDGNFAVNGFRAASLNTKSVTIEDENIQINFVDVCLIDSLVASPVTVTGVTVADSTEFIILSFDVPYKENDLIYIQYSNIMQSYLDSESENILNGTFNYNYDSLKDGIISTNIGNEWSFNPRKETTIGGNWNFKQNTSDGNNVWETEQNHNLAVNDLIKFTAGTFAPSDSYNLTDDYYVVNVINSTTIQVSDQLGGNVLSNLNDLTNWNAVKITFEYNWESSLSHNLKINDTIRFTQGSGTSNYNTNTDYYVIAIVSDTKVKLSDQFNGTVIQDTTGSTDDVVWKANKKVGLYIWTSTTNNNLTVNSVLKLSSTTGLTNYDVTNYYIVNVDEYTDNTTSTKYYTFKLSKTLGGGIIQETNIINNINTTQVTQTYFMKNIEGIQRIHSLITVGNKKAIKLYQDPNTKSSPMNFRKDLISGQGNRILMKTLCGLNCILPNGKTMCADTGYQIPFTDPLEYNEGDDLEGLKVFGEYGDSKENARFRVQIFMQGDKKKFRISTRISFYKKDKQNLKGSIVSEYFDDGFKENDYLVKLSNEDNHGEGILSEYDSDSANSAGFTVYSRTPSFLATENASTENALTNKLTTTSNGFSVFSTANTNANFRILGSNNEYLKVTGYVNDSEITVERIDTNGAIIGDGKINWYNGGSGYAYNWQDISPTATKNIKIKFTKKADKYPVGFYWNFDGIAIDAVSGDVGLIMNYDNINNAGIDVVTFNDNIPPSDFKNYFVKKFLRIQNYQTSLIPDIDNTNWLSSESLNLVENKSYKINNKKLLGLNNNNLIQISQNSKIESTTNNTNGSLQGTLQVDLNSLILKGTNTKFIDELKPDDIIIIGTSNTKFVVDYIESDTILYLKSVNTIAAVSGTGYKIEGRFNNNNLPKFTVNGFNVFYNSVQLSGTNVIIPNKIQTDVGGNWSYSGTDLEWTCSIVHGLIMNDTIIFNTDGGGADSYDITTTYYVVKVVSTTKVQLSLQEKGVVINETTSSTVNSFWKADKFTRVITGTSTKFTEELKSGDTINLGLHDKRIVDEVLSDTQFTVFQAYKNDTGAEIIDTTPMTNINLNNFFVVGDYLTFIDSANSNDTYNAYITSISTDGALIIINKQISGVNPADYLVSRNPKSFSVWGKDSSNSTFNVDTANNNVGINTDAPSAILELNQANNSNKIGFLLDANEDSNIAMQINADQTDATILDINADSLTSGSALNISSNANNSTSRNLVKILNDNTSATGTNLLYLKNDASSTTALFESTSTNSNIATLELRNSTNTLGASPILRFLKNNPTSVSNDQYIGIINFKSKDTTGAILDYASLEVEASKLDVTSTSARIKFNVNSDGTSRELLTIDGNEVHNDCQVVVNNAQTDCDFRVKSSSLTHMLFVDSGNNRVSIGDSTDSPAATLEITNQASAGVPLLQLNNNDVDKIALDLNANNEDTDVIDLTANSLTSGKAINITANSLTSGKAINITSTASALTNNLMEIAFSGDDANNTGNLVYLDNQNTTNKTTSLKINHTNQNKPSIKLTSDFYSGTVEDNSSETYLLKAVSAANATDTDFELDLDNESTYFVRLFIIGKYKDSNSQNPDSVIYNIEGQLDKETDSNGTTTLQIDYQVNSLKEYDSDWNIILSNNSNNLKITCQGKADTTRWLIKVELTKVIF